MAKGTNQKLKLVYLIKILLERTDDTHSLTMPEIIEALAAYDISAERKSIYADLETIRDLGIDIIGEQKGKTFYYHVAGRQFELAELKLLVDAIQSSKFITAKKSNELIKKLEGLASNHEAKQLQRHVFVSGRIKTMNESIYYNVDEIHNAILSNKKIRFQYFQWNVKKEMEMRRDGKFYEISPWALSWDDENYYLIGFDAEADKIKHYRVDKMLKIACMDEPREGRELFEKFDVAVYARKSFSMFGGEEQYVKLLCDNSLAGVIIDRFGKDAMIVPVDEEHFNANVNVAVSAPFFGWVFALGDKIKIVSPESVREQMKENAKRVYEQYLQE
ncbi:MAG: WYL domain-containing protein [Lachnospiraceae bacterium]|nr:WYL domain-containing protein [Lachnospiraceae bacterium]